MATSSRLKTVDGKYYATEEYVKKYVDENFVLDKKATAMGVYHNYCCELKDFDIPDTLYKNVFMMYDDMSGGISILAFKNFKSLMDEYNIKEKEAKAIENCKHGESVVIMDAIYTRIQ